MTFSHAMLAGVGYFIVGRAMIAAVDAGERKIHGQYGMQFWNEDEQGQTGLALIVWPLVVGGFILYLLVIGAINVALFIARTPVFIAGAAGDSLTELRGWWAGRAERRAARLAQIERDADDVVRMISEGR